jgi:AhpD family alkylhydroperoxidase
MNDETPEHAHRTEFHRRRATGNAKLLESSNEVFRRFFELDALAYAEGAVPARTKELLGLALSIAVQCDECVYYHLERCEAEGVTRDELDEVFALTLVGVGSVVVPQLRRAVAFLDG